MPAPRVINTAREKGEPSGVQQFFSRLGKDYKDKADRQEIGNLISQYQQNRDSATAWEDLQLGLQKSSIGPTKRLEAQEELNGIRKNVIEQDKLLNAKAKAMEDANKAKLANEAKEAEKVKKAEIEADKAKKTESEVKELLLSAGESPEEAERKSKILSVASARDEAKKNVKKNEETKTQELTQKAFDKIVDIVPKVGRGTDVMSLIGGKSSEARGEFTSLTGALEALLVEKVNRGALSNTRFEYITKTLLPKPTDSQAEIKGKLKGLATILELDPGSLEGKKEAKEEKKVPEGKVRVKDKKSGQTGFVTPYEGMEAKYDTIK